MLILTRKEREKLIINDNITIEIIEINKNSIKIGIEAPKEIPIIRGEIEEEIKMSNIAANKEIQTSVLNQLSRRIR
jgi:carbon storage regulator